MEEEVMNEDELVQETAAEINQEMKEMEAEESAIMGEEASEEYTPREASKLEQQSSVFSHPIQTPNHEAPMFPTWFLLIVLIISLFVLKKFIYIKDGKRHGK